MLLVHLDEQVCAESWPCPVSGDMILDWTLKLFVPLPLNFNVEIITAPT